MADYHRKGAHRQTLVDAAEQFVDHPYVDSKDAEHARRYLKIHHDFQPFVFVPPTEEMQTRVDLINIIWSQLQSRSSIDPDGLKLNRAECHFALAFFCEVPLFILRQLERCSDRVDRLYARVFLLIRFGMKTILFYTLVMEEYSMTNAIVVINGDGMLQPSRAGRDATKNRDSRRCVVTGKGGAIEACYICSTLDKDKGALQHLNNLWEVAECLFADDSEFLNRLKNYFESDRASDYPWNMITLNDYLHTLWDKAYFGFFPLGVYDGTGDQAAQRFIHVQFVWFFKPKNTPTLRDQPLPEQPVHIQNSFTVEDLESMYRPSNNQTRWQNIGDNYVLSGRPIKTGDVIRIRCESPYDEIKTMDMFRFRWALNKVQFLAGAGGIDFDDFDNPGDWVREDIYKWTVDVVRRIRESDADGYES